MYKIILICTLSITLTTLSCIPVQIVERERNNYPEPEEIVIIIERPIIIHPPHYPRPPHPPIYKPIKKPIKNKPIKTITKPPKHKRPSKPLRPVQRPVKNNPEIKGNKKIIGREKSKRRGR